MSYTAVMLRLSWLFPLVVVCACKTVTPPAPAPVAVWEVPLVVEPGRAPLVQATIGGKPTLLLIDTAASQTTLQAWFIKSLEVEPTDFEGHRVAALPLQLGTFTTTARWQLVDTDPALRELGIGGTISPHHLVPKGAVVIDFPMKRMLALDGQPNNALRWLDERSPKGQVEGLLRVAPFEGRIHVKTRVGDGREVVTALASTQPRSRYAAGLFDASLITDGTHVAGLHVRVGESEFGPLDVLVQPTEGAVEGWLGMDVLQGVVLLLPVHELHPIWFMTPH